MATKKSNVGMHCMAVGDIYQRTSIILCHQMLLVELVKVLLVSDEFDLNIICLPIYYDKVF